MTIDPSYVQLNRASTERIRRLVKHLTAARMRHPVGEHWTVAIALVHLAFWDRRVLLVLDRTEHDGKLFTPSLDLSVNDISLPMWAAIPPEDAAQLALESADTLDKRLEAFPEPLLEQLSLYNRRWLMRALHRNEHLDEVDTALRT
jgi:hypothetical protein